MSTGMQSPEHRGSALSVVHGSEQVTEDVIAQQVVAMQEYLQAQLQFITTEQSELVRQIDIASMSTEPVLILGETGTGKGQVARAIIAAKNRNFNKSTILRTVNMAEIAEPVLESELFGHNKGAFTGASSKREGLIQSADGAIFLDEICEVSKHVQAKLLRIIEEQVLRPVGSNDEVSINTQFLFATNRMPADGSEIPERMRADFFYRMQNVIQLDPYHKRPEAHKRALIYEALERARKKNEIGKEVTGVISSEVYEDLFARELPGNIRQLQTLVSRAFNTAMYEYKDSSVVPEEIVIELRHLQLAR